MRRTSLRVKLDNPPCQAKRKLSENRIFCHPQLGLICKWLSKTCLRPLGLFWAAKPNFCHGKHLYSSEKDWAFHFIGMAELLSFWTAPINRHAKTTSSDANRTFSGTVPFRLGNPALFV
jgi:hypothetical protein